MNASTVEPSHVIRPLIGITPDRNCGVLCPCNTDGVGVVSPAARWRPGDPVYRPADYRTPPNTSRGRA